ncbi:hypothetical protein ACJIZ3_005749 [Penstemon smallii]|uniref:Uncharacterized protein n=1 Tax=Penstemon smallii TaxID=265156 RepID=A0ABD3S5R8_9LAMI
MKETDRRRGLNSKERGTPARADKRDHKLQEKNGVRNLKAKDITAKPSSDKQDTSTVLNDSNVSAESSEVYEDIVLDNVDDVYRSEEALENTKSLKMDDSKSNENSDRNSSDMEIADESDPETINDSVSSQGDSQTADDEKAEKVTMVPKRLAKKSSTAPKSKSDSKANNIQIKSSKVKQKNGVKPENGPSKLTTKSSSDNLRNMKVHPKSLSDCSEGNDDNSLEQEKRVGIQDDTSNGAHSVCSDDEAAYTEENDDQEDKDALNQKIEEMETRIKNLEGELREVAALEIALYSVVPEHGSSAHKVHTPARRLSRLYIYACKYWSQDKRATVARNTVSGLVLVAKSCGNDVSRLTFWLSNTVVLREIISQAFGSSCNASALAKVFESNAGSKKSEIKPLPFKWKTSNGSRQMNKQSFLQFVDDWQETRTFTAALEKVESWVFSRIVESIWWQTLTPNMQSPVGDSTTRKGSEKLLGPALGDQKQGSFSINLWKNAFQDALIRLCPVRAGGHECGCLPVLARKVMEQCIGRLDVAMFNAILRESAHEIPTDPVSDPILDPKVLPIPAGDLSFGSGAQLKNSVGHWARWLSDFVGTGSVSSLKDENNNHDNEEPKYFPLLNSLSDLLMLPKDMLMDKAIRMEVCPSISLPLVKRVLCNFTPDEFCPDPVSGAVLEALNAECIIERRFSGDSSSSFPFTAAPIVYVPPSSSDVAEKVSEIGKNSPLSRSASFAVQKKGYTSDEELDEVENCLTSIIEKPPSLTTGNGDSEEVDHDGANARYDLLREVWKST